jgi:enediyne biosynthesis protein E7
MGIQPPGPRGELAGASNHRLFRADMFAFLAELARHGDVVGFDLGRSHYILVNSAPLVRELFNRHARCLRKPEFVKDSNRGYWGDGLTTLEGDVWRQRRHLLRASLGAHAVAARLPTIVECTRDMLSSWTPAHEIDLLHELRLLTSRIAARTMLGADIEGRGRPHECAGMLPHAEAFGEDRAGVAGGDPTAPLVLIRPRAPRTIDQTIRIIDERIAGTAPGRDDILSDLLHARLPDGRDLTREEIVGEVVQMLFAGHHTIPSTLVGFWRDLHAHPAVAARIAEEADHLDLPGNVQPLHLAGSYCLAALKESMRVRPPAPILYREVDTPFVLAGFDFARDAGVWVAPQLLHHDPRYHAEPHVFRPERFLQRERAASTEQAYLPFGAGPRTCVGSHQALLQMTIIGMLIVGCFELAPRSKDSTCFETRARP